MSLSRARRPCLSCGALARGSYCPLHDPKAGAHRRVHTLERERWAPTVATGRVECSRCSEPIAAGQAWHIDRRPWGYVPSHAYCDSAAGGRHEP